MPKRIKKEKHFRSAAMVILQILVEIIGMLGAKYVTFHDPRSS